MDGAWGGLVAFGLVVAVIVAVAMGRRRRHVRAVDVVARALGGMRRGNVVTFAIDGREYRCECFGGGRNQRPWIELRTDSAPDTRYSVVRPGGLGRIGEGFGRGERVMTGDADLDQMLRVYSPAGLRTRAFFSAPDRRAALRGLFDLGAAEVDQDAIELGVRWANRRPDADVGASLVPSAVVTLGRLADGTPSPGARAAARRLLVAERAGWMLFVALAATTGILSGVARDRFQVLDWTRLMQASLWYSVPVAAALAVWVVRSGMLGTARLRTASFGIIGGLVLVPYLALQLAIVANAWLDDGPAAPHDTRVLHAEVVGGRHTEYEATVASWRERDEERLSVRPEVFKRLRPGTPIRLVTKPGRFGYEWVVEYGLLDSAH